MSNLIARLRRRAKAACESTPPGCSPTPLRAGSLDDLVAVYIQGIRPKRDAERDRYARLPSLDETIRVAALSTDERGKRLSHQRRIPCDVLVRVAKRLRQDGLCNVRSFDELYERICELCGDIEKFGELTRYDVAIRIAPKLGLKPERVYLHCGARTGAKELGVPHRGATVKMGELPRVLHRLHPSEVEDFLCIYKEQLGRFRGAW
jgi:hypothetical protein